jgi:hypothetical protein
LQQFQSSAREQENRRFIDLAQGSRIPRVANIHHGARLLHLLLLRGGIFENAAADNRLRDGTTDPGALKFRSRRPENCRRTPESIQQPFGNAGTHSWDEFLSQPVKFFPLAQFLREHEARFGR